ncbi:MAG: arsenate reductase (glutaredoxin) [Gammaproteobacteria bacterium]|nr:arsenate reductase (glutaredoxin) [Gammaproteobacteria bacterium]
MKVTILHNPRCSKSRQALGLLQDRGVEPEIVEYLKQPLDRPALETLAGMLDEPVSAMVRSGEDEYKAAGLGKDSSDEELLAAIAEFPKLLQRPIVIAGDKAAIGRPPEAVLELLA